MAKSYQHLTYKQRCQIFTLKESSNYYSQSKMAEEIKSNQSTVSRELSRNTGNNGYDPDEAHFKAMVRQSKASSAKNIKLTAEAKTYIDDCLIKKQWSPEQISGRNMEKNCGVKISYQRIYEYIWEDKQNDGTLYKHLRCGGKKYKKRGKKTAGRGLIPNRRCIEERSKIVDDKSRPGDLEVDTIVGKNHKGAILTIVCRRTKLTFMRLLLRGTALNTKEAMVEALKPYLEHVHTITSDNGKEFAQHQEIAQELNADFYFAHPYSSWERGLNENTNKLIRQYFPKGTDFRKITHLDVARVQHLINTRPRKTLGYRTPLEVYFEETSKTLMPTIEVRCAVSNKKVLVVKMV